MAGSFRHRDISKGFSFGVDAAEIPVEGVITGTNNRDEVAELAILHNPPVIGRMVRTEVECEPQGGGVWFVTVKYTSRISPRDAAALNGGGLDGAQGGGEPQERQAPGIDDALGPELGFETGGGTTHIVRSIKTIDRVLGGASGDLAATGSDLNVGSDALTGRDVHSTGTAAEAGHIGRVLYVFEKAGWTEGGYTITDVVAYGSGVTPRWRLDRAPTAATGIFAGIWALLPATGSGTAPDNRNIIGLSKEGIAGCDIHTPQFQWSVGSRRSKCTMRYLLTLYALTGRTNNSRFWHFEAGELLYLGASGAYTANDGWKITHKFAASKNLLGVKISSDLVVPSKKGWEHLWVAFREAQVGDYLLQEPFAAYVEQVYRGDNFSLLEIGA